MTAVMKNDIAFMKNMHVSAGAGPEFLSETAIEPVRHLHRSVESYQWTPLVSLGALAKEVGVKGIYVKDESYRFGLNAFKGLGGIYALSCAVCERLGLDVEKVSFAELKKPEYQEKLRNMIFVTATDGNHGRGVAWAAGQLGCKAYVYMPKGSSKYRAQAIRNAGKAEVTITDLPYDDAVRYAQSMSREHGWILIQDTSWPGYEKVPSWIIQGYTTMAYEALRQLRKYGEETPTHVFLQAGVGAMAGGVAGYLVNACRPRPVITVVEPDQVACIYESARHQDGEPHAAVGNGTTIMAGLNCGEPCTVTWPILRDFASFYMACPDYVAANGMRQLAAPKGGDLKVTSGESGAATMGAFMAVMERPELAGLKQEMGLNENSVVLLFSTEGDTDPESYREIVYHGACAAPKETY
ncbi:MAG: diaminopropionate ammonia-lyase [Clostridiales bacterium]|nr:diaminopropionate ammonia-lyase [Clostridiales bacterium]